MEYLGLAMHLSEDAQLRRVYSALPDAPVVSDGREPGRRQRALRQRARAGVASGLRRLADVVAPARPADRPAPVQCSPAH